MHVQRLKRVHAAAIAAAATVVARCRAELTPAIHSRRVVHHASRRRSAREQHVGAVRLTREEAWCRSAAKDTAAAATRRVERVRLTRVEEVAGEAAVAEVHRVILRGGDKTRQTSGRACVTRTGVLSTCCITTCALCARQAERILFVQTGKAHLSCSNKRKMSLFRVWLRIHLRGSLIILRESSLLTLDIIAL